MRHRIKGRKLGRTTSHRMATLRSLATALIQHKKITTTVAKAKQLRLFVEPLITKAKNDSVHSRRLIARHVQDKEVLKNLFSEVIPKIGDRPGGYTRVIKLGNRVGDAAEMAIIELVDFNDVSTKKPNKTKKAAAEPVKKAKEKDSQVVEDAVFEEVEANVPEVKESDDLTKIEGIGPKIAEILKKGDIDSYAKLSESSVEKLNELLAEAGSRYKSHDPSTWPQQSKLAADGNWDDLQKLQDELDGGREEK